MPSTVIFLRRVVFKLLAHTVKTVYLSNLPHNLATFILVSIANASIKNSNAGVRYSINFCYCCAL